MWGMNLYPLLFMPVYRDYVWGGDRIRERFGRPAAPSPCAESWEISAHPDGMGVVENGSCAGKTLAEICAESGAEILGTHCPDGRFPILVKLIDAKTRLSVQVHPDEGAASRYGGEAKTEMWYILDAPQDAFVCAGLRPGVGPRIFGDAIKDRKVASTLRTLPVSPGKAVFIPGGLVHAICEGCLILEVQQSSNTTYRVYDWDRVDAAGKGRELHIDKALQVIDWKNNGDPVCKPAGTTICESPYFRLARFELNKQTIFPMTGGTFHALFISAGAGRISWSGGEEKLSPGQSWLVPAALGEYSISPDGTIEVLQTTIP